MPATRRSRASGGPATRGAQSTLSFGGSRTKVTKPVPSATKDIKNAPSKLKEIITVEAPEPSTTSEAVVEVQAAVEKKVLKKTEEQTRAEKVSDAAIKKYWKAREEDRIAARVHQDGLSTEEKILRLFDITSSYGPCIGMARMKRWVRANKLGLNPPIEVLAVLLKEEKKGNSKIERAYVDELMGSKVGVVEA